MTPKTAAELVQRHPAERIEAKIEIFDWLIEKKDKRVAKSPAGYLVKSIDDDYAAPKGFQSRAERRRREEARQAGERREAEERRRTQEEAAREEAARQEVDAYWQSLMPEEQRQLEADALAAGGEEARQTYETLQSIRGGAGFLKLLREDYIRGLLHDRQAEASPALPREWPVAGGAVDDRGGCVPARATPTDRSPSIAKTLGRTPAVRHFKVRRRPRSPRSLAPARHFGVRNPGPRHG